MTTKDTIKLAFNKSIPVMIGYGPTGIAYGILMNTIGFSALSTGIISLLVYAGSLQFLMISFFTTGISLISVFLLSALLNSRHIFYGIGFIEKFREYGIEKLLLIHNLSDESYSLFVSHKELNDKTDKLFYIVSSSLNVLYWIVFTVLGNLIGSLIKFNTTGIDFALTALFVVILMEQINKKNYSISVVSILASCISIVIFKADNFILPALLLSVVYLIVSKNRYQNQESNNE